MLTVCILTETDIDINYFWTLPCYVYADVASETEQEDSESKPSKTRFAVTFLLLDTLLTVDLLGC